MELCITWKHDLVGCPKDLSLPNWGPSDDELETMEAEAGIEILCNANNESDTDIDDIDGDEGLTDLEDEAFNDTGLMDHLDILDIYTVPDNDGGPEEVMDEISQDSEDDWEDME